MTEAAASQPSAPRIAVLRALGLGDLCTAVPALRALGRRFPDHRLTLLTPRPLWPLVRLSDAVDETAHQADLASALPASLQEVDLAVNLHGRGPQSTRLLDGTRPRQLVAFADPDIGRTASGPLWHAGEHEVDRWCRLVAATGAVPDRTDVLLRRPAAPVPSGTDAPAIVVHPGAGQRRRADGHPPASARWFASCSIRAAPSRSPVQQTRTTSRQTSSAMREPVMIGSASWPRGGPTWQRWLG